MASVALTRAPRDNRNSHMSGHLKYAARWRRVSYQLPGGSRISWLMSILAFGSPPAATQASITARSPLSPLIAATISGGAMTTCSIDCDAPAARLSRRGSLFLLPSR